MSAILMALSPEAVRSIASGVRKADVRKTFPHFLRPPFKVFIYENLGAYKNRPNIGYTAYEYEGSGMVVGECTCHKIEEAIDHNFYDYDIGITAREISDYLKGEVGYIFFFSDIRFYDKLIPIEDFGTKRPPQSWFHVKEMKERAEREQRTD